MDSLEEECLLNKDPKKIGDYLLYKELGKGSYGVVYLAKHKDKGKFVALKRYFKNLHPNIIILEILILKYLNKHTNDDIIKIIDGFVINYEIFFVSKFQMNKNFHDYFQNFTMQQIKNYMKKLLTCLQSIHKLGIVHRDIKPNNFLYDPDNNSCLLLDFGLSECIFDPKKIPDHLKNDIALSEIINFQNNGIRNKIGTRGFLAPEIIFNSKFQTSAVDIWAAGIILLGFLTLRMPVLNLNKFSKIKDETIKDLVPLIIIFGRERIIQLAKNYDVSLYVSQQMETIASNGGLRFMVRRKDCDENIHDLLTKMLELDENKRITASEALEHPFFKE